MAGWTAEEIRAEIRRRGTTVADAAASLGLNHDTLRAAIDPKRRVPSGQKALARFLGQPMHVLWPQHYKPGTLLDRRNTKHFAPAVFEAILRRVRAGEKLHAICREPGQPTTVTVYEYRRANPDYARRWREGDRRRGKGIRLDYPEQAIESFIDRIAAGERATSMVANDRQPDITTVRRHMRGNDALAERWAEAMGQRPGARISEGRLEMALAELQAGRTQRSLTSVSRAGLWKRRLADAKLAARVADLSRSGAERMQRQASARKLSPNEIYALVERSVRNVPSYARDDIRGDLMMALLEGTVVAENAGSAVRGLMTAWNRQFARRDISMDAEIGDDGFTFAGLIADASSLDAEGSGHRVLAPEW